MAAWRRRAIDAFPELRHELQSRETTIYLLYMLHLLPMIRDAHEQNDLDRLHHIYDYAEWCSMQKAKDLWNAAGVSFYEHLFDQPQYSEQVVKWLSPNVVFAHWTLWEAKVSEPEWNRVRPMLEGKRAVGERMHRLTKRRT